MEDYGRLWKGILIEPIPELYEICKINRNRAHVFNYAIVGPGYKKETIKLYYAGLMSITDGCRRADETANHIKKGLDVQKIPETYEVDVPAITLKKILDSLKIKKIDFMSLDVEGAELEVLKGLDLTRYRPSYILVEANIFYDKINNYLTSNDYHLIEKMTNHDYFYVDKNTINE